MHDHSTPTPRYAVPRGGYSIPSVWKFNEYRVEGVIAVLLLPNRAGEVVAEARIDAWDLARVLPAAHWTLHRTATPGLCYAKGTPRGEGAPVGRRKPNVLLHRLLMEPGAGQEVDHDDGDGLNCCRDNMALVTRGQNALNKPHHRRIVRLERALRGLLVCGHRGYCDCKRRAFAALE